ncbi:hypothetical protein EMQ25_08175 [Arsenicitalea aurantiaca]|uniref:DUF1795 domain-containing protein n=1 Tax=Arsenicitalea aurantiaca TaxID=1783274 RepID=A0A433XG59_9HYPH|nr:hypothetical protein [Arsenicitalea aurantiaca]RUT33091.1 hypothetical protein EMQ25_08175 [Arsenicitalea aurantiaca]
MRNVSKPWCALPIAALLLTPGTALAQAVSVDRGLTEDRAYTVFYPDVFQSVDDQNEATVITLRHPDAAFQCDVFVVDGGEPDWDAEGALSRMDVAAIEDSWRDDFPDFALTSRAVTTFQSGPALYYEGASTQTPMGVPISFAHAEAVDEGRTYVVECFVETSVLPQAKPLIDFIIANFSTRSDGECCRPVDAPETPPSP